MVDAHYTEPRLAALYDPLDQDRSDLEVYAAMAAEFGARSVLDIGCGTGTLACLLASRGLSVTGLDPALASLDIARAKPFGDRVRWVHGPADALPPLQADLATMTGNVAQVFITDEEWGAVLAAAHAALRPGGRLVFETRDPARQAWLEWGRPHSYIRAVVPGIGGVEAWGDVTEVSGEFVTFRSYLRLRRRRRGADVGFDAAVPRPGRGPRFAGGRRIHRRRDQGRPRPARPGVRLRRKAGARRIMAL